MNDDEIIRELGEAVLKLAGGWGSHITCDNGQYTLYINSIPISVEATMRILRAQGWNVTKDERGITMSRDV